MPDTHQELARPLKSLRLGDNTRHTAADRLTAAWTRVSAGTLGSRREPRGTCARTCAVAKFHMWRRPENTEERR